MRMLASWSELSRFRGGPAPRVLLQDHVCGGKSCAFPGVETGMGPTANIVPEGRGRERQRGAGRGRERQREAGRGRGGQREAGRGKQREAGRRRGGRGRPGDGGGAEGGRERERGVETGWWGALPRKVKALTLRCSPARNSESRRSDWPSPCPGGKGDNRNRWIHTTSCSQNGPQSQRVIPKTFFKYRDRLPHLGVLKGSFSHRLFLLLAPSGPGLPASVPPRQLSHLPGQTARLRCAGKAAQLRTPRGERELPPEKRGCGGDRSDPSQSSLALGALRLLTVHLPLGCCPWGLGSSLFCSPPGGNSSRPIGEPVNTDVPASLVPSRKASVD